MQRRTRRGWAFLGSAALSLACGSEATPGAASGGNGGAPSGGMAGTNAAGGATNGGSAGSAGSAPATSGSGGQNAGAGGALGGSSAGGGGGAAGAGAASGSSGMGGDSNVPALPKRMLLYHFSTLAIPSVPQQLALLKTQLESWGYTVEDSVNPADLSATNLARFGGVGMINTCFEPFGVGSTGDAQTAALKTFVENGGGLFGTHCAAVTFQSADPPNAYNALIGGRGGHGSFDGKSACTTVAAHPTTTMLSATFDFTGNLDNADYVAADSTVLVKCKWSGGDMKETPVSWYRTPGKGRVFYTNFGKVDTDISDPTLGAKHILLGLGWVLGR